MASGYYPPGAEYDPDAPYNQEEPPEVLVELTATETLTKTISAYTNKVWRVYDEEGYGSYEKDGFDPRDAWDEETDSLETTLSKALEEITALRKEAESHIKRLKVLEEALAGWESLEREVESDV